MKTSRLNKWIVRYRALLAREEDLNVERKAATAGHSAALDEAETEFKKLRAEAMQVVDDLVATNNEKYGVASSAVLAALNAHTKALADWHFTGETGSALATFLDAKRQEIRREHDAKVEAAKQALSDIGESIDELQRARTKLEMLTPESPETAVAFIPALPDEWVKKLNDALAACRDARKNHAALRDVFASRLRAMHQEVEADRPSSCTPLPVADCTGRITFQPSYDKTTKRPGLLVSYLADPKADPAFLAAYNVPEALALRDWLTSVYDLPAEPA